MRWIAFLLAQGIIVSGAWGQSAVLVHRGTVAADVLQLRIRSDQQVVYCKQVPYEKKKGDKINDPERHRWVLRNFRCIGSLLPGHGWMAGRVSLCGPVPGGPAQVTMVSRIFLV